MVKYKARASNRDLDHRASGQTIGMVLAGTDIPELSDYEFDVRFLAKYRYRLELAECCYQATLELWSEPYLGRVSNARVMGRAMELLREKHGLDAPRGWVPVMRKLRASSAAANSAAGNHKSGCEYAGTPIPVPPAEEVLTSFYSAVHGIDRDGRLLALAEQQPALKELLVRQARNRGVPTGWYTALPYMNAVLAELGDAAPGIMIELRNDLQARVDELRENGLAD